MSPDFSRKRKREGVRAGDGSAHTYPPSRPRPHPRSCCKRGKKACSRIPAALLAVQPWIPLLRTLRPLGGEGESAAEREGLPVLPLLRQPAEVEAAYPPAPPSFRLWGRG